MNKVGPGIWRDTLKNVKNEKCTPWDLGYGEKPEKRGNYTQAMCDLEYGEKH